MDRTELMHKLEEIFQDVFDNADIRLHESTSAADIANWDSLATISILASVQDEFSVRFEMNEIVNMKCVGDIIKAVEGKL